METKNTAADVGIEPATLARSANLPPDILLYIKQ